MGSVSGSQMSCLLLQLNRNVLVTFACHLSTCTEYGALSNLLVHLKHRDSFGKEKCKK